MLQPNGAFRLVHMLTAWPTCAKGLDLAVTQQVFVCYSQYCERLTQAQNKLFWTLCRIPLSPFVVIMKAGQLPRLNTILGDNMPHYLISGYLPDNYDPSLESEETIEAIHALNREMIAAGVRRFAGGLGPAKSMRSAAQW